MRLTVIGCSGSFPGPDSPASSYLVEAEHDGRTWRILLDLGSGALGTLQQYVDPADVDALVLSHLHPDHCFDISGFYVMRKYHPDGPKPRIPVYGPRDTAKRMANAYGLSASPGMTDEFDFQAHDESTAIETGPFRINVALVNHPVEAYAIKVDDGNGSLVYSGDTGPCDNLVTLASGTDVFLAEASFREGRDNPGDLHLTGKQAAEAATKAGVGRLVLTHIPPWYDKQLALDEALPSYDGPVELARTGATYDI